MKKITHISASKASQTLGQLISRVGYGGESVVITKYRRPICQLVPIGDDCQQSDSPSESEGDADLKL